MLHWSESCDEGQQKIMDFVNLVKFCFMLIVGYVKFLRFKINISIFYGT